MINTWPGWKNVKLLGRGSFGSVYEIEKEEFGKVYKAALKVISIPTDESEYKSVMALGMDDQSTRDYFYESVEAVAREFSLLNELKGFTNIVSYEDHQILERTDRFGWDILIRMELLTPLEEYQSRHEMEEKDICQLGIDICKALEICRQKNILHRDIKPANIFVNMFGNYKLGDFGIARTIDRTQGTLSHKGTYNYMAPEVYLGKKYGYTADIYSLGIVLYRLLNNNRLPFLENRVTPKLLEEAMVRRMDGEKIPPLTVNQELSNIIQKCIEYKPEKRYQSAEELRRALEKYLRDKEVPEPRGKAPLSAFFVSCIFNDLLLCAMGILTLTPILHLKSLLPTTYTLIQVVSIIMIGYGISLLLGMKRMRKSNKTLFMGTALFMFLISLFFLVIPINSIIGVVFLVVLTILHFISMIKLKKENQLYFVSKKKNCIFGLWIVIVLDLILTGALFILTLSPIFHWKWMLPVTYSVIQYVSMIVVIFAVFLSFDNIFVKRYNRAAIAGIQIILALYLLLFPINTIVGFGMILLEMVLGVIEICKRPKKQEDFDLSQNFGPPNDPYFMVKKDI